MTYWWVNHKRTWKIETSGGFLWAPRSNSDGSTNQSYLNLTRAKPGDIVFSYAAGKIRRIGSVDAEASISNKPNYRSDTPWSEEGWLLPVCFSPLKSPIVPLLHIDAIAPLLPSTHSPLQRNGHGNLTYLSMIPESLGELLLQLGGVDRTDLLAARDDVILDDLALIASDASLTRTERIALSKARIGQGVFRTNVLAQEPCCRVTGVMLPSLLRASHIKAWRSSTNRERLDGANGLMLAPHVDLLFDKHLISFTDRGELILSPQLDSQIVQRWHLNAAEQPRPFNAAQREYLCAHRELLL